MSSGRDSNFVAQLAEIVDGASKLVAEMPRSATALPSTGSAADDPVGLYHAAAAVLSSFDRATLQPANLDLTTSSGDDVIDVLADSIPVRSQTGGGQWKMLTDVRRSLLQQLGSRDEIQRAIDSNPSRSRDPIQATFEAYVSGTAPSLEQQDLGQLAATFEVAQWLEDLPFSLGAPLPDIDAIRSRSDYLTLLKPFDDLAGDNFAGREDELKTLRDYVGVLAPGSFVSGAFRAARKILNFLEKAPLVIHGPGGVGKSALIARFIWEHANIPNSQKFPFVYLDFDRAGLRSEEPLTLMIEAIRQVGLQYPEARPYAERVRGEWQQELVDRDRDLNPANEVNQFTNAFGSTGIGRSTAIDWLRYARAFGSILRNVRDGKDPCLFVLDTFEEVQYQGETVVASLCEFLKVLQGAVPRMRIVVSGRVPLDVPDFPTDPRPLGDFDEVAADLFLQKRGVRSPQLRQMIIKRIGRSPLSLLLAATAVTRAEASGEQEGLEPDEGKWSDMTEAQIQGALYRRILAHIKDLEVAQIAYPGLALRRVTPEIIRTVLAKPCNVTVPDDATAANLFERLAREVSLVHFEDDALVHRRDVRRIMLPLLRESQKDAVAEIEDAAILYYAAREGSVDRAEEIYHRLARRQPFDVIAERWDDDAKPYLFNALDPSELGARERAWLLTKLDPGRKLADDEREAADLETWEWDTERRARELVEHNRLTAALQLIRTRKERSTNSPLYALETDILERLDRLAEALTVADAGIAASVESGNRSQRVDLLVRAARLDYRTGDVELASRRLLQAEGLLTNRQDDAPRALRIGLTRMAIDRRARPNGSWKSLDEDDMQRRLAAVSDSQLGASPDLALWVARDLNVSHGPLRRVIGLLGLELRPGESRTLARAIALWDDSISKEKGRWKGTLGGGELPWAETLTQAWTQLLREWSPAVAGERIGVLLAAQDVPSDVLEALYEIVDDRAGEVGILDSDDDAEGSVREKATRSLPSSGATAEYSDGRLRLDATQKRALLAALLDAFPTRQELTIMIRYRLDRSIDSIAFSDNLRDAVASVIEASLVDGWTGSLVSAALESRPDHTPLLKFAESLGIAAAVPSLDRLASVAREGGLTFDPSAWRSRLGLLEARVCRIEQVDDGRPAAMGTGFLLGPNLLLTTYYMVEPVIKGQIAATQVRLRFDYKRLPDGVALNPGTEFRLYDEDWLVCSSPTSSKTTTLAENGVSDPKALDYGLLRVAGAPGNEPIGGDRAEPGAPARGWIEPPFRPYDFLPGSPLFILHHAQGGPIQVSLNRDGVIGLDGTGTRVRYHAATAPGSGGAPCFDAGWDLVALHEAREKDIGQGIPISLIVRDIEEKGMGETLSVRSV